MDRETVETSAFRGIVEEILGERVRQDRKWGSQKNHGPERWVSILGEEFGEAACDANEHVAAKGNKKAELLLHFRKELIEVAAVAVAAVECIDRKKRRRWWLRWLNL